MDVVEMEGAAQGILNGRTGRVTKRKRRPIPVPPSTPAKPQEPAEATSQV